MEKITPKRYHRAGGARHDNRVAGIPREISQRLQQLLQSALLAADFVPNWR